MNLFPTHINLNGQQTAVAELLQQIGGKMSWEKEWLNFLAEWYDEKDFIEVNTSGSTGTPKTIQLKKNFVATSARRTIQYFDLKENDRVLHCLPTQFIAGKLMVVRALIGQFDLHVVDPSTDFSFLKSTPFKFAAMVPNQVQKTLNLGISNLEALLIGGSAVPQSLEKKLHRFSTACYSSYAMTETATHIALRKINESESDDFYHCLNDIRVDLSEEGCLQIFMPGLAHTFLQTTDFAELKDERTFRIVGRSDHVIISGGLKFSPEKLEKKLEPYIAQAFMISSLPHNQLGQQLVLLIEGDEKPNITEQLNLICKKQLEKYEQPRQVIFISQLPRTPSGKLNRISKFA